MDTIHIYDKPVRFFQQKNLVLCRLFQADVQPGFLFSTVLYCNIANGSIIENTVQLILCSGIDFKSNFFLCTAVFKFSRTIQIQHNTYTGSTAAYPHLRNLRLRRRMQK